MPVYIDKNVLVGFPASLLKKVDKESKRLKTTRTELIRVILRQYFQNQEQEQFVKEANEMFKERQKT